MGDLNNNEPIDQGQDPNKLDYMNSLDSSNNSGDDDEIGIGKELKKRKTPLSLKGVGLTVFVALLIIGSFWTSFHIGKRILTPAKQLPELDLQKEDAQSLPSAFSSKVAAKKEEAVIVPPAAPKAEFPKPLEIKKDELLPPAKKIEIKKEALVPEKKIVIKKEDLMAHSAPAAKKEETEKKSLLKKAKEFFAKKPEIKKEAAKKEAMKPFEEKTVYEEPSIVAEKKPEVKKAAIKKAAPAGKVFKVQVMIADTRENANRVVKNLQSNGFDAFARRVSDNQFSIQAGAFKNKENADSVIEELESKGFTGKIIRE